VRFAALFYPAGSFAELGVLQGTCDFVKAAQEAVREWRYSPTLADGKPVWVLTQIEVIFTLSYR
jgi:hypothetical protein